MIGRRHAGYGRRITAALLIALGWVLSGPTRAEVIDDIEVRSDQGVTEIRLQFTVPVRYIKHFPQERGTLVKLYLQVLALDGVEETEHQEYKRTPSFPLLPPFRVAYSTVRNCFAVTAPLCLDIQFSEPVRYRIRQGEDGRSILFDVLPEETETPKPPTASPATH